MFLVLCPKPGVERPKPIHLFHQKEMTLIPKEVRDQLLNDRRDRLTALNCYLLQRLINSRETLIPDIDSIIPDQGID